MPRGKGEGNVSRVPADPTLPLKYWQARIELPSHELDRNGNPIRRRKTIRRKDKAELVREMNKARLALVKGGDLPTASQTVATWLEHWARDILPQGRRPRTIHSYRLIIDKGLIPHLGRVRLDQLTPTHVRAMLKKMETAGSQANTLRNAFGVLSAALKDAEREGRIARNPCTLMDMPKRKPADLQVLNLDEVKRVLSAFAGTPDAYVWATFLLTGARRGEVVGLEWDRVSDTEIDISWQMQRLIWSHGCGPAPRKGQPARCGFKRAASCPEKHLEMPKDFECRHLTGGLYMTRPKSNAGLRVVPLVEPLRSWMEQWRAIAPPNPYGLVFSESGGPLDPDDATRLWPKIREELGITKHVRIHDLRHTAIDMMYEAGADESSIIRIFGHSTVQMSRSYRSLGTRRRETESMVRLSESLGFSELTVG